tara:strand:+ start:911 stop:1360 length:450 start_codon:yes stop_codon:yes gene_type:complete
MKIGTVLKLMWLWPPFLGAGIRVKSFNEDFTQITVQMKLRFWNKNYVGTHFGGSLYTMTDPFYMLILIHFLGKGFHVWDKSAKIRYVKPGRGTVYAHFKVTQDRLKQLKDDVIQNGIHEEQFMIQVLNESSEVVAEITKTIHIRVLNVS